MRIPNTQKGFTLLEVLLAVSITAGIGIGASQLLSNTSNINIATKERFMQLRYIQRMDLLMRRDFWQLAGRKIRDGYTIHDALISNTDYLVEFTRSGVALRDGRRSSGLQRVAYAMRSHDSVYCKDAIKDPNTNKPSNCFIRLFWPVLDRAADSPEPIVQVLLDDIEEVSFWFKGQVIDFTNPSNTIRNNDWQDVWPSPYITGTMESDLLQVKIKYKVKKLGDITRIYEVPRHAFIR